ncbi:MAG: hypothetical protein ABL921_13715 [Pirellula sp.]
MTQPAPVYVQATFGWDVPESNAIATMPNTQEQVNRLPATAAPSKNSMRPSAHPPICVPSVRSTSSVRRGRCEHVGGVLASVLEKYGITIDQLIEEIDGVNG